MAFIFAIPLLLPTVVHIYLPIRVLRLLYLNYTTELHQLLPFMLPEKASCRFLHQVYDVIGPPTDELNFQIHHVPEPP